MNGFFKACALFALGATGISLFAQCSDNDNPPTDSSQFNVTPTELSVAATGGSATVNVVSDNTPSAAVDPNATGWCRIESVNRHPVNKHTAITISAAANPTDRERTATITVTAGDKTADVTLTQAAGEQQISPEPPTPPTPGDGTLGGSATDIARSLGMGWNLGNNMDSHSNGVASETVWGNPKAQPELFAALKAAGISTVRIPVTWLGHIGAAPDYTIEPAWLDRVAELVGQARDAGLFVIINIHHDGGDSKYWLDIKNAATDAAKNTAVKAQLAAMWTQIANRFADEGSYLIFEAFNEIHDGGWGWGANRTDGGKQYAVLNEWNQTFVDAVRATGGNNATRYLGIPSYCTNPDYALINEFKLPADNADNRLMVAVHYYAPTDFSLSDKFSEWGHTADSSKKDSWGDEAYVKDTFGKLKTRYIDNNIPVYIGETGCVRRATERSESFRKYYLEYVCKAAHDCGMAPIYWDNGAAGTGKEQSGLFRHSDGQYLNNGAEIVAIMVKAVTETDPAYTLQSVYNAAP